MSPQVAQFIHGGSWNSTHVTEGLTLCPCLSIHCNLNSTGIRSSRNASFSFCIWSSRLLPESLVLCFWPLSPARVCCPLSHRVMRHEKRKLQGWLRLEAVGAPPCTCHRMPEPPLPGSTLTRFYRTHKSRRVFLKPSHRKYLRPMGHIQDYVCVPLA